LLGRYNLVHQSHVVGFLGRILSTQIPDLAGSFLANHAGELDGAKAGVEAPHLWAGLTEFGSARGDRQITQHVQDVPPANAIAIHHGHHGLGDLPDQAVELSHM
jgi:hypothetical protein